MKAKTHKGDTALSAKKMHGRIYTPSFIVELMLNQIQYESPAGILQHHIIDNSCGDGAFLAEIANRYCHAYISTKGRTDLNELLQSAKRNVAQPKNGLI